MQIFKEPLFLILTAVSLGALGQLSMKVGMRQVGEISQISLKLFQAILNPFVFAGFFVYLISSFLWLMVLSKVRLSYAYPFISVSFVLVSLLSWGLLREKPQFIFGFWAGIMLICLGVVLAATSWK